MLPSTLYLSRVSYSSEKRQIIVEFSNRCERVSQRHQFFPKFFFQLGAIPEADFRAVVAGFAPQKFKVTVNDGVASVFAASFSDLKALNNFLGKCFGSRCNIVEPERQFLMERGWNYFDSFSRDSEGVHRLERFDFPDVNLPFLSAAFKETVTELLRSNDALANDLLSKAALSRILRVPLMGREAGDPPVEILLENIFFTAGMPLPVGASSPSGRINFFPGKGEIDFSRLVAMLSSRPFSNIGFETMNCQCCRPSSPDARNILPSGLVKVRFLREGFYFSPFSMVWAHEFHESMPFRELRESRMREYCHQVPPAGPFSRGSEGFVMLIDAVSLERQGFVEVLRDYSPAWFCTVNEGSLSREVNSLLRCLSSLESLIHSEGAKVAASNGLFFSQAIGSSPEFFYRKALKGVVSALLSSLPAQLITPGGRFFSKNVAMALEALNGGIARDFEDSVINGCERVIFPCFSRAVVDKASIMTLAKRFSELYNVEMPLLGIRSNS
ncbi:MAG: hypothetical protein HY544_03195 [Candidatus Diapherotrites archaeon]|uniref:Uncharacterized protein n=1 Tax=Candidatus Iainarchaeum sp. TaxID=3101447 RepID=A0A8T3YIY3_9ARCH|nr:hypothetical protein [Candidatus Diapherotrites archaeon]